MGSLDAYGRMRWGRLGSLLFVLGACSTAAQDREDSFIGTGGPERATSVATGDAGGDGGTGGPAVTSASATDADADGTAGAGIKLDVAFDTDGTGGPPPPPILTCDNIDELDAQSRGCEFWGTTWQGLNTGRGYGIGVGNPSAEVAHVVIEDQRGVGGTLREIVALDLQPGESQLVEIAGDAGVLGPVDVTVLPGANADAAFRVTSDQPITAMQIAPVGGGPSHVAEASLLLPTNALAASYLTVGYTAIGGGGGRIAVVATKDATTVTTTQGDVMLDAFDVHMFAVDDSTGFFVGSTLPVAVFAGTTCSYVPPSNGACDHLEEQIVPLSSWGTEYVAGRHPHRVPALNSGPEPVYWRVVAAQDATTIQLSPAVPGVGASIDLATFGDFFEFSATESFVATSDQPFMLAQYMSGCTNVVENPVNPNNPCNEGPTGDPYMLQMPPVEQWLIDTPFLTDTSYPRDFVVIMREAGTTIELACLGVVSADHFTPIPGTSYEVGFVDLDTTSGEGNCQDGQQYLSADGPVGVLVGGLDWATSYGYPGGLSFAELWTPPTTPEG